MKISLGEIGRLNCPYLVVHDMKTGVNALVFSKTAILKISSAYRSFVSVSESEFDVSKSNAGSLYITLFLSDPETPGTDSQSFIITVFIQNHWERNDALNQCSLFHCFHLIR